MATGNENQSSKVSHSPRQSLIPSSGNEDQSSKVLGSPGPSPALSSDDETKFSIHFNLKSEKVLGPTDNPADNRSVHKSISQDSGKFYVVKVLKRVEGGRHLDPRQEARQRLEIALQYLASAHEGIVPIRTFKDEPDFTQFVMDYYPEGDLHSKALERKEYVGKDSEIQETFLQILDAVEHCHRLGIYHRDIKPGNLLLDRSRIVLTDFGWATINSVSDEKFGTIPYRGPETMTPKSYKCAPNDIWALGVVLVNLTGNWLWNNPTNKDELYLTYVCNKRGALQNRFPVSDELLDILVRVLEPNPKKRIGISELRNCVSQCSTFFRSVQPSPEPITDSNPAATDKDTKSKVVSEGKSEGKNKDSLRSFFPRFRFRGKREGSKREGER